MRNCNKNLFHAMLFLTRCWSYCSESNYHNMLDHIDYSCNCGSDARLLVMAPVGLLSSIIVLPLVPTFSKMAKVLLLCYVSRTVIITPYPPSSLKLLIFAECIMAKPCGDFKTRCAAQCGEYLFFSGYWSSFILNLVQEVSFWIQILQCHFMHWEVSEMSVN